MTALLLPQAPRIGARCHPRRAALAFALVWAAAACSTKTGSTPVQEPPVDEDLVEEDQIDLDGTGLNDAVVDAKGDAKGGAPQKKPLPPNAQTRFEKSYMELDEKKALVANVAGSRKVMQISLSLMTQYDDRVFQSVEKHRAALRSAALNVLRLVTEADLVKPDFRSELAQRLCDRINAELERLENFGGIEEVFFTEFVYQ